MDPQNVYYYFVTRTLHSDTCSSLQFFFLLFSTLQWTHQYQITDEVCVKSFSYVIVAVVEKRSGMRTEAEKQVILMSN